MTSKAGRPRKWTTGLVVFVAIAAVVAGWALLKPDTYVARQPDPAHASARPDLAAVALDGLVRAVRDRDADRAATLAGDDESARRLLRAVVDNAIALEVTDFSARYVDESGSVTPDGRWSAAVDLAWRFDRFDAASVHEEVGVEFAAAGESATITGWRASTGSAADSLRRPLWLSGPLRIRAGAGVLTLGPDEASVARYAEMAEKAISVVGRVVKGWTGPLVVEVPGSEAELDAALGTAAGTYAGVAAVTASVDGSDGPDAPVHVFVNPEVMAGLDAQGAQVVISHEVTHVATAAATNNRRPIWLTEGFADYVALRDVDLPLSKTAGQVIEEVRRNGVPDHLPDRSDFDSRSDTFGAEYEAAWLACRVVADRSGQKGLVAVYDRVGAGEHLDAVLRDVLGVGTRGLTRLWQDRLSDLAT